MGLIFVSEQGWQYLWFSHVPDVGVPNSSPVMDGLWSLTGYSTPSPMDVFVETPAILARIEVVGSMQTISSR
jgi:hypothetical protein